MRRALTKWNQSGPCGINIDEVCKRFKKQRLRKNSIKICSETFISKWHDEYKLVDVKNMHVDFKCQLYKSDALKIIEKLALREEHSGLFKHGSTFRI
jgi:hypothetical protein